jgi:uncharacterized membrane protein HdeD (DUF308 family)
MLMQTLRKNWWLLAVCGLLEAAISVIYLILQGTDGPLTFQVWGSSISWLGKLTLAAGVCTIAAGLLKSANGRSWLLVLNGLALVALGLIQYGFTRFPISFLTVTLLIFAMAMSLGVLEFAIGRILWRRRHAAGGLLFTLAGLASGGFALAFFALGFRWITLDPGSHADLLWLGLYFAFSAICMLGLALRLHKLDRSLSGEWEALPSVAPGLAH